MPGEGRRREGLRDDAAAVAVASGPVGASPEATPASSSSHAREHLGELVQMDGSFHDWFEGRRGWATLMVMIDDATGMVTARFYEKESWASSSDSFQRYARRHGVPRGLYVDQHGIYRPDGEPTDADLLDNCPRETQFGRADARTGRGIDSGSESASERACGADERDASRSVGEGLAASEDLPTWSRRTDSWTKHFWRSSTRVSRWRRLGPKTGIVRCWPPRTCLASCRFRNRAWWPRTGRCVGEIAFCNCRARRRSSFGAVSG